MVILTKTIDIAKNIWRVIYKKVIKSLSSVFMSIVLLMVSISNFPAYATTTVKLQNYPVYQQYGPNCWAYAILSMTNYMYGGGYNIDDIYNAYEFCNW